MGKFQSINFKFCKKHTDLLIALWAMQPKLAQTTEKQVSFAVMSFLADFFSCTTFLSVAKKYFRTNTSKATNMPQNFQH